MKIAHIFVDSFKANPEQPTKEETKSEPIVTNSNVEN
jgi:hypothetical protein